MQEWGGVGGGGEGRAEVWQALQQVDALEKYCRFTILRANK